MRGIKMSNVNYHVLANSVVVNYNGETKVVAASDRRYAKILKAIKEGELEIIPSLMDLGAALEGVNAQLLRQGDSLYLDGELLNESLTLRLLNFIDNGLPCDYLIKFIRKLRLNPSFNSRNMLFKFLENNGHPITQDGNFIAYRGVTAGFKDVHTGTFDNSVGSTCSVPRDSVDDNPNNTCSSGLHVACFEYAKGFGSATVEVEVDPKDVVCVPTDYNGTKMRVCKFIVKAVSKAMLNQDLYGHDNESEESDNKEVLDMYQLRLQLSSVMKDAWYNPAEETLTVALHKGNALYHYYDVPQEVADCLEYTASVGSYYANYIAHEYEFDKG
jgi:hypothetical protein